MSENRLTIKQASQLMGLKPQTLRIGLQRNIFTFGKAIKTGNRYVYWISRELFEKETGIEIGEKK